jgi:hypothetical protein
LTPNPAQRLTIEQLERILKDFDKIDSIELSEEA